MTAELVIDLADGAMLAGKYRVEKLLGKGGMGAVYLAENVDIGRKVAIKVLHADFASDPQILQRFRMEARAAAAIGHPGIVDVLDLGTTPEGAEFIVMERLEGETLGARIKRAGALHADEAIPIVCDVLDALAAAHDKGIIHRDLKPENIFLVERPVRVTKILDFGISKFAGAEDVSLTRTGAVMGSPLYMSPEQARGAKDISHATDLYSIGAILYEALSGVPPFQGSTYNEVLASVLMEAHTPLVALKPELTAALSTVVDALLAKEAGGRPPDARSTRSLLRRAHDPGLTDLDVPTVRQGTAGSGSHGAERASIAVDAMTRPQPEPPSGVQQQRTAVLVLGAGLAVVLAATAFAVYRKTRPAPTPIPAPTPTPASAPAKSEIALTLTAQPPEARWFLDGEALGCNPCTVRKAEGEKHHLAARADGRSEWHDELAFDAPRELRIELPKLAAPPPSPTPSPHERKKPGATPHGTDKKPPDKPDEGGITIDKSNPFK